MIKQEWDSVIRPNRHLLDLNLKELVHYYDLLVMLVKKEIVVNYKQTVLGPLWFFLQPVFTTITFVIIFGNLAGIPTGNIPMPLFYLSGIIVWNFFSECFNKTSNTFTVNAGVFGKVYFPRLISPLSIIISNGIKFLIQLALFLCLYFYYFLTDASLSPNWTLVFFPFLIVLMAINGLGFGLIFSSLTTKYKDLTFLIQFGVQLLMYASPIIYPMSSVHGRLRMLLFMNPLSHVLEGFKFAFFGEGTVSLPGLVYSVLFSMVVLVLGIIIFNRTEKSFMDTV